MNHFRNRNRTAILQVSAIMATVTAWIVLLLAAPTLRADQGYLKVDGPCDLTFPEDHGPHPGYRTEWWYYTGNLTGADGRSFGFQLTIFRHQIAPTAVRRDWPSQASAWRTDTIYLGHAAVTDIAGKRHLQAERINRPVLSMAGATQNGSAWTIHIGDWKTTIADDRHEVAADAGTFSLHLNLSPAKPIVLHGKDGYSRKGEAADRASCYYSFTRLKAAGTLSIEGRAHDVTGEAWMDHEFSTAPLEPGLTGWDWFSLQLSDGSEIMVFLLRQKDGGLSGLSSGTYIAPSGETRHLKADDLRIRPLASWTSPHTGARYPVEWEIAIPELLLQLKTAAKVVDQEMRTPKSTNIAYWEGSIGITGTKSGDPVAGLGYIEMTGYARPFDTKL